MPKKLKINAGLPQQAFHLKGFMASLAIIWTLAIASSYAWNTQQDNSGVLEVARTEARTAYEKDILYRRWNAGHGGVYVPKTEKTQSNPYLNVPERDITTPSGRELTLINPAFMTRQVHEIAAEIYGVQGHITSLKPIRPANEAAEWEKAALKKFEGGLKEYSSVELIDGKPYMHLIRPLMTEQGCLACHASQGYAVGDVRGGISVAVPMAPIYAVAAKKQKALQMGHGLLWVLGLLGLFVTRRMIHQQMIERDRAEAELQRSQKLESMGQLAGGLAHEINSPIQYLQDNTRFFSESLDDIFEILNDNKDLENNSDLDYMRSEMPKAVNSFNEGLNQIATIVQAMIDISRPGCSEMQETNINELISSAVIISRNRWMEVAELETDLDPDFPLLSCIPGEFSQIILNLIFNSTDSIKKFKTSHPEHKGMIRIATRNHEEWTEISFSDNGQEDHGLSQQGLVMVQNIVTEIHGGSISFETEEEAESTIIIRFPVLKEIVRLCP